MPRTPRRTTSISSLSSDIISTDRVADDLEADRVHVAVLGTRRLLLEGDADGRHPIALPARLGQVHVGGVPFDAVDVLGDPRDGLDVDGARHGLALVALERALLV